MKIKATVVFDSHERTFNIPCGTGDKTIKWLGLVASQRYSNAAPNGALRRRDDFCGISENVQYQVDQVYLPGGKIVHPGIMIFDSDLKDGDEVTVKLCSKIAVLGTTGSASHSKWSMLAFSTSNIENPALHSTRSERGGDDETEIPDRVMESQEEAALIRARAAFMRVILHSQVIDVKSIVKKIDDVWPKLVEAVPLLLVDDTSSLKQVLSDHWDVLSDLYTFYAQNGTLDKDQFFAFLDDSELFPATNSSTQCAKIYSRTCKYCNTTPAQFSLDHLLVALLLSAQVKFNDTCEAGGSKMNCSESLAELFRSNFDPLAERLKLQSVLKYAFCSDECLSAMRLMYDDLQAVFNKSATKLQDVPTSLPVEEVNELFVQAILRGREADHELTRTLIQDIRKSTIFGTEFDPEEEIPSPDEVSFPEFMECSARAGFFKFGDVEAAEVDGEASETSNSVEGNINSTIVKCLIMGVKAVIEISSNASAEKQSQLPKAGRNRRK
jgi:hypothetical protein